MFLSPSEGVTVEEEADLPKQIAPEEREQAPLWLLSLSDLLVCDFPHLCEFLDA